MPSHIVTYELDDRTNVQFEIDSGTDFRPASPGQAIGNVREAVGPALEAAKTVLDKVKEVRPDQLTMTFGIKVTGAANWLIAKAATEGNFEITLSWNPGNHNPATPVPEQHGH